MEEVLRRKVALLAKDKKILTAKYKKARKKILTLKRQKNWLLDQLERNMDSDDCASESFSNSESFSDSDMESSSLSDLDNNKDDNEREEAEEGQADPDASLRDKGEREDGEREDGERDDGRKGSVLKPPKKIPPVELNEEGQVPLPLRLGIITLVNLGKVVWDNPAFHNQRYIFPEGFETRRSYASARYPDKNTSYTCKVRNIDGTIRFELVADDDPETLYHAPTATGAWTHVLKEANRIRHKDSTNSASGPDYFGFSNPTIVKLIQDLPNARKCSRYVWQEFVITEPPKKRAERERDRDKASAEDTKDLNDSMESEKADSERGKLGEDTLDIGE